MVHQYSPPHQVYKIKSLKPITPCGQKAYWIESQDRLVALLYVLASLQANNLFGKAGLRTLGLEQLSIIIWEGLGHPAQKLTNHSPW